MPVHAPSPLDDDNAKAQRHYRSAVSEDVDAIHQILREANLSIPRPEDREQATHHPIGQIFTVVCEFGGAVLGVLQWRDLGDELEILDLAVLNSCRRSGHGSFLLQKFLRDTVQTAARQIFLEVRESNLPAIALYQKFGFAISGRRPNYYRHPPEAALLMQRAVMHTSTG